MSDSPQSINQPVHNSPKSINHEDLADVETGLYALPDVLRRIEWDLMLGQYVYADRRLHARVLAKRGHLPPHEEYVVRRDGHVIVKQWVIETILGKFETLEEAEAFAAKRKAA
jgi:hypothetical protein